jgi:hypothetical protein
MMTSLPKTLQNNLAERRLQTIAVFVGMFGAILVLSLMMGFTQRGTLFSTVAVFLVVYNVPVFFWFWGRSEKDASTRKKDDGLFPSEKVVQNHDKTESLRTSVHEAVIADNVYEKSSNDFGTRVPRKSPVGTRLISQEPEKAELKVHTAVRFWCWVLPLALAVVAVLGSPIGAAIGFDIYDNTPENYKLNPVSYTLWGGFSWIAAFLILAIISYFKTRPKILIVITPNTVTFGDYKFARRFSEGFRIGYKTNETDLTQSFLQPKWGMISLRFSYGPWGEDTIYLVDAYHADAIVNWTNQIIDTVGEPLTAKNDPYGGRKIELL